MNNPSLNILLVASEFFPYAKVGGLADMVSSLSMELGNRGHDVRVVIPQYSCIDLEKFESSVILEPMGVWMGNKEEWCSVRMAEPAKNVRVYIVDHKLYFHRWGLYHDEQMNDYDDNPLRFGFLSRAALQLCKDLQFRPDIVHGHDWQTSLVPAYLKIWHWNDKLLGSTASVLTIHNAAYQGIYPNEPMEYLGLGWQNFTEDKFETYQKLNFLKGGIHFADVVTAVSPTFAREITTPHGGFGLAPYLSSKGENLVGIINGIDYSVWDPQTDPLIPGNYTSKTLKGKLKCKRELQKLFDLEVRDDIALIGTIGRFVEQKGFQLIRDVIEGVLNNMEVQFVILGTGDSALEEYFGNLPSRYPGKVGSYIGFDNRRAHVIEAGADFFAMPSIFEPCGLNQMYSQRYGTLPIVHATGGLDDTVVNYDEEKGTGTGFKYWESSPNALYFTIGWAVSTYYDRPDHFKKMIKSAMQQDFSWERSAQQYESIYQKAIENKRKHDEGYRLFYW